jgi:glycerol-1-phosphate dehydrogenase [NAD(P)+]
MDILHKSIEDMPGMSFDCDCGRRHAVDIRKIIVRSNILPVLPKELEPYKSGRLLILADRNTYRVLGEAVVKCLDEAGFSFKTFVFDGEHTLVPDERALGRILLEMEHETTFILGVGSGTINDMSRFISYRVGIPFAIVGTAPSMDGFASVVSPLIIAGRKVTYPGHYPDIIFADTSVMKNAPMDMIRAGYGDVIGKLTARTDWNLARILEGDYYCETTAKLVQNGVAKCIECAEGIAKRDEAAIGTLVEALIMTGVSMGLVNVSRPASGAEHLISHYWEVDAIAGGREHQLHGNAVGTGTVIISMLYELTREKYPELLPDGIEFPSSDYIISLLNKAGSCTSPKELGISRELFRDSVLQARRAVGKFTILNLLEQKGKLPEFAEVLTRRFYD